MSRFETKGYKLVAMKTKMATPEILDEHYKDLVDKPFFPKLREYLLSGPVVCMCWEGKEAGKYTWFDLVWFVANVESNPYQHVLLSLSLLYLLEMIMYHQSRLAEKCLEPPIHSSQPPELFVVISVLKLAETFAMEVTL